MQLLPLPSGVAPVYQALEDHFVVWVHLPQRKLDLRPLAALASKVLAHAPQAT